MSSASGKLFQPASPSSLWPRLPTSSTRSPESSTNPTAAAAASTAETACSSSTWIARWGVISRDSAEVRACRLDASASARWRSVTSLATTEALTISPSSPRTGEIDSDTMIRRPSLVTRSVS